MIEIERLDLFLKKEVIGITDFFNFGCMTPDEFKRSLSGQTPPPELNTLLQALWYDAKDNWNKAHNLAQEVNSPDGSWVHAYLHRKEGDTGNASYWYSKAGKKMPSYSLSQEWEEIVKALL